MNQTNSQQKTVVDDELLLEHNQGSVSRYSNPETEKDVFMKAPKLLVVLTIIAVLAGIGTGFGTFRLSNKQATAQLPAVPESEAGVQVGSEFGSTDSVFDSHAIGYVEKGGLDGEGSHKLLRPGGDSQTVYLTSSVTDLDTFVGMEVEIWGETFKGQKAGWFMDVGRVKVISTNAEAPVEE